MNWYKCMKISFDNVYEDPLVELDELEFAYCLPKWFWTRSEWNVYTMKRVELVRRINEYREYRREYGKYEVCTE